MTDRHDPHANRMEYLESLAISTEAVQLLLDGVELIKKFGVDGIVQVANTQPETILTTIVQMSDIIKTLNGEVLSLSEDYFALHDASSRVADLIEKATSEG